MLMHPVFDIHTHRQVTSENDVIRINSIDPVQNPFFITDRFFSPGVHPWSAHHHHADWFVYLVEKIAKHEHCVAIGECGLDYSHSKDTEIQINVFIRHVEIAEIQQLPLIIHCVGAFHDLLRLRKELKPECPWIIHGFAKSAETAVQCIDAGCFLSFGKKSLSPEYAGVINTIPADKIFAETDDADLDIQDVYNAIAKARGLDTAGISRIISGNVRQCFKKLNI